MKACAIALAALIVIAAERSGPAAHQFRKANPCPSTGRIAGACPGWEVDHRIPLCAGGADRPENMQWLTKEKHAEKTREDVMACRKKSAQNGGLTK